MGDKISIPNKSHFTFDEVATITGVKKYVLRFWETEFDEIDPIVSSAGQKLFEHKSIEAILKIKKLLFDDKYTIEKAKVILSKGEEEIESFSPEIESASLEASSIGIEASIAEIKINHQAKLVFKEKIQAMLDLAESLEKRHNWK